MLNSTFPTRACPAARVVKNRKRHVGRAGRTGEGGQDGEGVHGLPALREALGAWRVPVTGRKGCGLNSARRTALRPRGRPWVPGGDKASASSSNAGSRALGLAGHMALASGARRDRRAPHWDLEAHGEVYALPGAGRGPEVGRR